MFYMVLRLKSEQYSSSIFKGKIINKIVFVMVQKNINHIMNLKLKLLALTYYNIIFYNIPKH